MIGGETYVDQSGVVSGCDEQRIEGVEVMGEAPPGGEKIAVNLTHPVVTGRGRERG